LHPSHCSIFSRSNGQWVTTKHPVVGENGESYVSINEWAHQRLYGHGLQEDYSDEAEEYKQATKIREDEAYFYDVDNWAHEKLYGHKKNEDFSIESEENALPSLVDEHYEKMNWKQQRLYTDIENEIASKESTESTQSMDIGDTTRNVDANRNWAYPGLYYEPQLDENILNNIDSAASF